MSAYFIAATGTGVGKTFTTCALLHAAQLKGREAHGFKPVISGFDPDDAASDTRQLIHASGSNRSLDDISPWRFAAPLSAHRAAALENKTLDITALTQWTKTQAAPPRLNLFETVGGVMVPLTDEKTTLDWMADVKLPVILVTGSYLGTISHTLTALEVLCARKLNVAALVLNETDGSTVTLEETQAGLAPYIRAIALKITQPRVSSWQDAHAIHALLEKL